MPFVLLVFLILYWLALCDAVPLVRYAAVMKHPEIRDALRAIGGKISEEKMRRMNYAVDGVHRDVKAVVKEFLEVR